MGVRCAELLVEDVIAGSALRDFMGRLPPNVVLVFFCWGGGEGGDCLEDEIRRFWQQ